MLGFLATTVTFELAGGILNAQLGLEKNFGLADRQFFFTGSVRHRFTPKSGLYARYYGIKRSSTVAYSDQDYIFLGDTIPAGSRVDAFFNTQVVSIGYLYTLASTPTALFAGYFNIYLMDVNTGLRSDGLKFSKEAGLLAPLPDFGVIASFAVTPWLQLDGVVGFFTLNVSSFSGRLNNLLFQLNFKPKHWLGLTLGYENFIVRVQFPEETVNTVVDYDFKGPSLGVSFVF
jgi:hypothetical protein